VAKIVQRLAKVASYLFPFGTLLEMSWAELRDTVSVIAAVIAAFYAVVAYHRPKGEAAPMLKEAPPGSIVPRVIICILSAIILGQAFLNYRDRGEVASDPVGTWGVSGGSTPDEPVYTMAVNAHDYLEYKDQYHLMLIVRIPYADIDEMSDKTIEKSALYKITDQQILLAHVSEKKLRFPALPGTSVPIQYVLVALPDKISPDAITSLGDVEALGGKILAKRAQTIVLVVPTSTPRPN
jgi:hypothetical protein